MRSLPVVLALVASGCARSSASRSSHSAATADFAVVDLSTCRRVVTPWPTALYDKRFGRARVGADDSVHRIAYAPVTFAPRADTGVDPFHCATRAGR